MENTSGGKVSKSARKLSGYEIFSKEKREELRKIGEKITIAELGREWTELNQAKKNKYIEKADKINNKNLEKFDERETENGRQKSNKNNKIESLNNKNRTSVKNKNSKYIDEKLEKFFSEEKDDKKKNSSRKKNIILDSDNSLSSETGENKKSLIKNDAINDKKSNLENNNLKTIKNKENRGKKHKDEDQMNSINDEENVKSDKIFKQKTFQNGIIYKKDRKLEPKLIRVSVEIWSSWGYATKLTRFIKLVDELKNDFDVEFTVSPLNRGQKGFYIYYGKEEDQKMNLVFSNKDKIKSAETFVDQSLSDALIKKIVSYIKLDMV